MSVQKRYGRALLHTTALMAALFVPATKALADPTGGTVTSGSAAITSSGPLTTITQSTDRAIIRWDTFDIDASEHVQFLQPGSSSITINRIRDTKPSNIQGKISANGNIVLINPNGLIFGASSVVDVGGLVATTSDIEDDNAFMNGGAVKFTKPGLPDAKIINNGNMTVRDGGLVGLVAPNVENHGVIQARLGKVQLASGDIHTIDFAGDGLIKLEVSDAVLSQSVTNTGTITADGGEILLTAAQARHMVDALVTNTGTLRADTVTLPDGTVETGSVTMSTVGLDLSLPANVNITQTVTIKPAQITNTGTISTNGNAMDQVGGDILILADNILIGDGSVVTATGDSGGGSIRIGGDYQGGNGIPTSDMIYVSDQAILNANSTRRGNGGRIILWSDTNTRFYGHAEAMGDEGGFIEISSKGFLDFNGTADLRGRNGVNGTLLLDPTNITISAAADSNVTGASPFTPNADTVTSVLNATTLLNALAGGNVMVQTRATGGHLGTITVDAALNWTSGSTLTLDAHNAITVNQAITANSGGLTMIAGADVVLNADISGTGVLTIRQNADTVTFGVAGGAGTLNLAVADLNHILDGWSNIVLGRDTATVAMTVNARTWTDNLTLQSGSGTITFAGATALGANNLTISTNGDISLPAGASWTGTGTLTLQQSSAGTALSMGGGAGTAINLTNAEFARVTNGWGNIVIGRTDATNTMTLGAVTYSDFVTFQSGTGLINVTGVQTMGTNTLTFLTDGDITLGIANALNGSTTVTFSQVSQNGTIGLGDGQAGTMQFTNTEVARIRNGWTNVIFGRTDGTGDINVGALTWNDSLTLRTGSGAVNLNGTQTMSTNALNITTVGGNIATGAITSGALTLNSDGGNITTSGAIAAAATTINSGGGLITLGSTLGATTLGITTGNSNLTTTQTITATSTTNINSGTGFINLGATVSSTAAGMVLTSSGNSITTTALTSGALTVNTNNGNFVTTGAIAASGAVNITVGTGSINLGTNASSAATAMNLTSTGNTITTANLTSGALTINSNNGNISTGTITASSTTNINSGSGTITIGGNIAGGTNTVSLTSTNNTINTAAIASGGLTIATNGGNFAASGNIGSGAGAMNVTTSGGNITTSGVTSTSGAVTMNSDGGTITIGSAGWTSTSGAHSVNSGTGNLIIDGVISAGSTSLTLTTDSDIQINATNALTGTGTLTIQQVSSNVSMGIGDSQAGTVHIGDAERSRIVNGWTTLVFGRTDSTAAINVGALSWSDAATFQSGSGQMTIAGATMAGNTLILRTDSDVAITGNLTGTGTFALVQASSGTSMGVGDGMAGTVSMSNAELAYLVNGWASLIFGRTDSTADINIGTRSWSDALTLRSGTGQMTIHGNQTMATNNLTITTDSDVAINGNLTSTGTGTLTISGSTASTTIALGTAETGTIKIDDTEMGRIMNAWASITIGSLTQTGAMNVGAVTWADPLTLRTGTGIISINGNQTMGANALTITSDADIALNANLSGSTSVTIAGSAVATSISVGTTTPAVLNIDSTELTRITDGWTSIVFGTTSGTGAMNIGAATWNDSVFFRTASGIITVDGAQNVGTNNLSFQSNANIAINAALTGTGSLTLAGSATSATLGVGTGAAGANNINDTELAFITDGWSNLIFGSTAQDGALTINALTWTDSVDFRTESGTIVFTGAQNVGANNLVIRSNVNFNLNQTMAGTGTITILGTSAGTTMGIGDSMTGTVNLTNAELANIADGWNNIVFGSTAMTGAMNVGAYAWNDNLTLRSAPTAVGNTMSLAGATMGANNLTITTNWLNLTGAVSGSGDLIIESATVSNTMGVGTSAGGNLNLADAEVGFLSNGWNSITIGSTTQTGVLTVNALTWNDNLNLKTLSGLLTVAGATMGSNNLTMQTNSALTISGNLSGTGTLTILPTTAATTMGLAGGTGTLNLTNAELNFIVDGWSNLIFGRADSTATVNVSARTWTDNVTIMGGTGTTTNVMTVAAQTMGANDLSLITNSNLALTGNMTGTGTLTIGVGSGTGGIGVGTGQAGTLNLTNAELAFMIDGWSRVLIGGEDNLGVTNIGAYTWVNPMSFVTQGDINVNGDQVSTESSGNSLVFATTAGSFINSAGSDALNPGGGRYLVYSVDALDDSLDGITPPTIVTNSSYSGYGPGSVVESGNVHIYSGIVAKILHLTIDNIDKIYGDSSPVFTYSYVSGLQNGDLLSSIIASYSLSAAGSTVLDNAGITRTINGTFTLNNGYTYVLTTGTMTVIKADLTVEIDSDTREYGDANGTFSATYTGFRNGDDDTDINTLATLSTTATALSNAGNYDITGTGASDNNYNFIYSNGTLEVTKATLVATSQNATREYGAADPTYTFNYTGFRNGDTAAMIDTGATGSSAAITANVGNYAITGSAALDNNYTFTYANTGVLTVTKAMLTATTQNATREYGATDPAFNVVYTGLRNGDTAAVLDTGPTISTTATIMSNVGSYGITASGAVDNNYNFTYVNTGTLSVAKAMLTATTQNATREYGAADPAFSIVYTGFRNGETQAVIDTLGTASSAVTATTNVGSYTVTGSGATDGNYDFTYANTGNLSITKAVLTATTQNATREYGAADPTFNIVYTGFKNGETQGVIDTLATGSSAAITANVGSHGITGSGASDNNYDFTYVNTGNLSITKAMLTIAANNASREVDEPDPAFTANYSGFRNGDTASVLDTAPVFGTAATALSPLGDYAITVSGAADNNYDFTYTNGILSIVPAPSPPASPTTSLPTTVQQSLTSSTPVYLYGTLLQYQNTDAVNKEHTSGIVFINDEILFSGQNTGNYLIAISEQLRQEYYYFEQDSEERSFPQ